MLQEQEFERLGGSRTIRVDVRLVAATNRDLAEMVAARTFRNDLYYRLRVFPLVMPPLRERQEDIPALVRYFVEKYARRMNRIVDMIPAETTRFACSLPLAWKYPRTGKPDRTGRNRFPRTRSCAFLTVNSNRVRKPSKAI